MIAMFFAAVFCASPPSTLAGRVVREADANAICAYAFRNGLIEDIHASVDSDGRSRITDPEMKQKELYPAPSRKARWLWDSSLPSCSTASANGAADNGLRSAVDAARIL
jgi:hypothetical protein